MNRQFTNLLPNLAWGLVSGVIFSVLPLPFNLLGIPLLVATLFKSNAEQTHVSPWLRRASLIVTFAGVVVIASLMPLKRLDRQLPPLNYGPMTVTELADSLERDHNLWLWIDPEVGRRHTEGFHTERAMQRREVLIALAQAAEAELEIKYCASGASILLGSFAGCSLRIRSGAEAEVAPSLSRP